MTYKIGGGLALLSLSACATFWPLPPPGPGPAGARKGQAAAVTTAAPWAAAAGGLVGVVQGNPGTGQPSPLPSVAAAGCAKDTDCKGDRVCDRGACVASTP